MTTSPPSWSRAMLANLSDDDVPDSVKLRALAKLTREAETHLLTVRKERLKCAARLREKGVAMADIAKWAGVSDSYLTRKLLDAGLAPRRYGRRQ